MSGDEVVYVDVLGIEWTQDEWDAMADPPRLRCEKHDRRVPCRTCLRDEGFYDSPERLERESVSDRAVEGRYTAHDAITFAIRDVASSLVKNCGEMWAAADDFAADLLAAAVEAENQLKDGGQ